MGPVGVEAMVWQKLPLCLDSGLRKAMLRASAPFPWWQRLLHTGEGAVDSDAYQYAASCAGRGPCELLRTLQTCPPESSALAVDSSSALAALYRLQNQCKPQAHRLGGPGGRGLLLSAQPLRLSRKV